jgi:hypothetical protein
VSAAKIRFNISPPAYGGSSRYSLGFGRALFLSPCRLWFADNGHINVRCRAGNEDSFALSDRGLGITRRNVHDSTIVRRSTIVLAFGGEGWERKAPHYYYDDQIPRHSS